MMNSKTLTTPHIPGARRPSPALWLLVAAVLLALVVISGLSVWQGIAQDKTVAPAAARLSGERFLAQNPELSVAARYTVAQDEAAFLAQNPELSAAARYTAASAVTHDEAAYLAQNPELSAAARYTVAQDEAAFLA
jgi:hypothetical protein